jgi:hypothetical protein
VVVSAAGGGLRVARGFESKSVADQQESAQDKRKSTEPPAARRRTLELARVDVQRRLETAGSDSYREMLKRTLAAVDKELAEIP